MLRRIQYASLNRCSHSRMELLREDRAPDVQQKLLALGEAHDLNENSKHFDNLHQVYFMYIFISILASRYVLMMRLCLFCHYWGTI